MKMSDTRINIVMQYLHGAIMEIMDTSYEMGEKCDMEGLEDYKKAIGVELNIGE